jgi:hypothetical protein
MAVTGDDVRAITADLPRSTEALVRDSVRWRIGSIVYCALSPDEEWMGFAYPKEMRDALVGGEPEKFVLPKTSDLRFNWVHARLAALEIDELRELVLDGWRMCVPKKVAAEYFSRKGV